MGRVWLQERRGYVLAWFCGERGGGIEGLEHMVTEGVTWKLMKLNKTCSCNGKKVLTHATTWMNHQKISHMNKTRQRTAYRDSTRVAC